MSNELGDGKIINFRDGKALPERFAEDLYKNRHELAIEEAGYKEVLIVDQTMLELAEDEDINSLDEVVDVIHAMHGDRLRKFAVVSFARNRSSCEFENELRVNSRELAVRQNEISMKLDKLLAESERVE